MIKIIISIFLIFISITVIGQKDTASTQISYLNFIKKSVRVESNFIFESGQKSILYSTADSLWNISSVKYLTKLTDDKNPIIRCYAFLGLIKKDVDKGVLLKIYEAHINDTAKFDYINGCSIWTDCMVVDYMETQLQIKFKGIKEELQLIRYK